MKTTLLFLVLILASSSFISLESPEETYVNVFDSPQIVELNKTLKKKECNNKYYLPIDLPKNAKGLIYSITTISKREKANLESVLLDKVIRLAEKHEASKLVDFITHNDSKRDFNLYILQKKTQAESFFNCGYFEYVEKHINTKSRSSYIEKTNEETYFIGIENNRDLKNLRLKIEVVAVM